MVKRVHTPQSTVDIVIATNRESPYLDAAIASVMAQERADWRLVLVDDGCPSPGYVRAAVANVPNAVVVRQSPQGPAAARNRGIREGSSPLIAFLDDDDVWAPDRLRLQVAAAAAAPTSIGVYSAGWYIDAAGREFGVGWPAVPTESAKFLSGAVPPPRIVTLLVRRGVCEDIGGFNETFRLGEDNEFILRLAMRGDLVAVPQALVGYRRHAFNSSVPASLEGRLEVKRYLSELRAQAAERNDLLTAALLDEQLLRFQRGAAADCITSLGVAARRHVLPGVLDELRWAATNAPLANLSRLSRTAAKRVGRELERRSGTAS